MRKMRLPVLLVVLSLLMVSAGYATPLDLSTFTAETGAVAGAGGQITFTESDSPLVAFYCYDSAFVVGPTATALTFDYSFKIGAGNDDYLVAFINAFPYEFEIGGYNPSSTASRLLSGSGTIDLTPYSTIFLAFGFEANDQRMDSIGTFSNLQINHSPVPEPTTLLLLGIGLIGLAGAGRKTISNKSQPQSARQR
jgi:hypothetical protein